MLDNEIRRNGSGYVDMTAYKAIRSYMKGEKEMDLYQGDIFTVQFKNGQEREAVILAVHDNFSTILVLGDNDTQPYAVKCNGMKYTNPGMLSYMFNDCFTGFIRSMKNDEYNDLMKAVIDALGYEAPAKEIVKEAAPAVNYVRQGQILIPETEALKADLTKAKAERDIYKSLYDNLISSMIAK